MAINNDEFRAALSRFPSGVTVVTTKDLGGRPHGITVSAFSAVSLEPPLVLICIDKQTASHYAFEETGRFAVNILHEDQVTISAQFASPLLDKFDGINFREGIAGIPVLEDALVNLECRLKHAYEGGDHTIFVGEIERTTVRDGKPLVYFYGDYRKLKLNGERN